MQSNDRARVKMDMLIWNLFYFYIFGVSLEVFLKCFASSFLYGISIDAYLRRLFIFQKASLLIFLNFTNPLIPDCTDYNFFYRKSIHMNYLFNILPRIYLLINHYTSCNSSLYSHVIYRPFFLWFLIEEKVNLSHPLELVILDICLFHLLYIPFI